MKFATLEGRRVAVWGAGREGRAALAALARRLPDQPATLLCTEHEAQELDSGSRVPGAGSRVRLPSRLTTVSQKPDAETLTRFDIVIKSPGISAYKPEILAAQQTGTRFTSGTALWFGENPGARVIGVTGTKGKSTTAAMIAHLARSLDIRTALAGNIGLPLLELDGQSADLWVVELSSFQTGEAGPLEVGLVTSLFPEHLDWHGTLERYLGDKLRLANVSRTLLVNAAQPEYLARSADHGQRERFAAVEGWHLDADGWIARGSTRVLAASELTLPGRHNRDNACAALAALELAGFDAVAAAPALAGFRALPHRLQPLGARDGHHWFDDSISTTPQAVLAFLESIRERPLGVILGGHDRGLDWAEAAAGMAQAGAVHFFVQGRNADRIATALAAAGAAFSRCRDLDDAVRCARQLTPAGGAIALSPGAPSFDQFRDYAERGRRFAELAGFDPAPEGQIPGVGIA